MKRYSAIVSLLAGMFFVSANCFAQGSSQRVELDRKGETIVLEPYAPNILRVTLSLQHDAALAAPGYGFVGTPKPRAGPNRKPTSPTFTGRRA